MASRTESRRQQAATVRELARCLDDLESGEIVAVPEGFRVATGGESTPVRLVDSDAITVALEHAETKTALLVFCSSSRPGGGWENGARAQEEDVALCSTWALQAEQAREFYRAGKAQRGWGAHAVLWCDRVWLLARSDFSWLRDNPRVAMVGVAAPNLGAINDAEHGRALAMLEERLGKALSIAEAKGIERFVGGAIGCGVFRHDPERVASIWVRLAASGFFRGEILLAVPGGPDDLNHIAFRRLFA